MLDSLELVARSSDQVDHVMNLGSQVAHHKGFGQHLHAGRQQPISDGCILRSR